MHRAHPIKQSGLLPRPGGAELYWETSGNPNGLPALYLHGGPGSGLGRGGYRRRFDPARYRVIALDQRGCERSTPWACDDLASLDSNTTAALIEDIEALREHLAVDSWIVHGVSWGTTLGLAYAIAFPERVKALVLTAVTTTNRDEVDWITNGVGMLFPESHHEFTSWLADGERPVEAYARELRDPDPDVRQRAADAWDRWETSHVSLDRAGPAAPLHEDPRMRLNFATLVTHYWSHSAFLPEDAHILDSVGRIAHLPATLIHGRRDVSGPAATAWKLHRAWPASVLSIVEFEGHGGPEMMEQSTRALDEYAERFHP